MRSFRRPWAIRITFAGLPVNHPDCAADCFARFRRFSMFPAGRSGSVYSSKTGSHSKRGIRARQTPIEEAAFLQGRSQMARTARVVAPIHPPTSPDGQTAAGNTFGAGARSDAFARSSKHSGTCRAPGGGRFVQRLERITNRRPPRRPPGSRKKAVEKYVFCPRNFLYCPRNFRSECYRPLTGEGLISIRRAHRFFKT